MFILDLPVEILQLKILPQVVEEENASVKLEGDTILHENDQLIVDDPKALAQVKSGLFFREAAHLPSLLKPKFLNAFACTSKTAHKIVKETAESIHSARNTHNYAPCVHFAAERYLSHVILSASSGVYLPIDPPRNSVRNIVGKILHQSPVAPKPAVFFAEGSSMTFDALQNRLKKILPFYAHPDPEELGYFSLQGIFLVHTFRAQNDESLRLGLK